MKKLIITASSILIVIAGYAQSIKNYTLGKKLEGNGSVYTTVGGVQGTLFCVENDDDIIHTIVFLASEPNEDDGGLNPFALSKSEAAVFAENVENHYDIKFERNENDSIISYRYIENSVVFMLGLRKDIPLFTFTIEDKTFQPVNSSKDF